jgi:hypothetical protein
MSNKKKGSKAAAPERRRLGLGARLALNLLTAAIGLFLLSKAVGNNESYNWLWHTFAPSNLEGAKMVKGMTPEQRLAAKLGLDFNYVMILHDYTPDSAVVYFPSKDDFLATPSYGEKLNFSGALTDKMTAIRFLYPRKVVIESELGHTSYAKRITHVGIVNGKNVNLLPYPVDSTVMHTVLPVVPNS